MRPVSKEIKEIQGTFEPSKEPTPPVDLEIWDGQRMPAADEKWPPNIQEIWNKRCKELFRSGYLAKAFLPHLRRYCFQIMQAEKAEEMLLEEGFVLVEIGSKGQEYNVMSPWISVLEKANRSIDSIGAKFGFTPLDIQKIPVIQKPKETMSLLK